MVGDGLNDAGALQQSDVGVAVVENVGAFSPASDAIIAANRVPSIASALHFSKQCVRVVKASLGLSAIYNVAGIALAAQGLLSPIVCAILMPLSSVTVVAFGTGMAVWLGRRMENVRPPRGAEYERDEGDSFAVPVRTFEPNSVSSVSTSEVSP